MDETQLIDPSAINITFTEILGYILLAAAVAFIIHSVIATYHWFTYGTERSVPLLATIIYNAVGGLLLLGMLTILFTM